jgi:hypothetical protein
VTDQILDKSNPPAPQGHSRVTTHHEQQLSVDQGSDMSEQLREIWPERRNKADMSE